MHLLRNDWSICSDTKCRVCAEKRALSNTMTVLTHSLKEYSGSLTHSLNLLTELKRIEDEKNGWPWNKRSKTTHT